MRQEVYQVLECESNFIPLQTVLQIKTTSGETIKVPISRVCKLEISKGETKIYCTTYEG